MAKFFNSGQRVDDHFVEITEMVGIGGTELAANLLRATQAEEKLRREKIVVKLRANRAHHEVGAKVRQTIKELGGTMPEHLPVAESINRLEPKKQNADIEERGKGVKQQVSIRLGAISRPLWRRPPIL